jgi:hypothetical protein
MPKNIARFCFVLPFFIKTKTHVLGWLLWHTRPFLFFKGLFDSHAATTLNALILSEARMKF